MVTQAKHYVKDKQVSGRNGWTPSVFNPARGEQTRSVPIANAADVTDVCPHARAGAGKWQLQRTRRLTTLSPINATGEIVPICVTVSVDKRLFTHAPAHPSSFC